KTLEKLTKVRIDHFSILDFAGFATMTDALGGVDVQIGKTVTGTEAGTDQDITWKAGRNHLDGGTALAFVRQRHGLPDGDLDRIKRQQAFLKALMSKAIQGGTLRNPLKLNAFLDAVTRSVSVDSSISGSKLRSLAFGLRGLGPSDVTFMTVPVAGTATVKGQSIVRLRTAEAQELYGALREDQVDDFLTKPGRANSVDRVR
ncbi:MAG: LCP family protein, partial [Streptosporangiaceae bacterium]